MSDFDHSDTENAPINMDHPKHTSARKLADEAGEVWSVLSPVYYDDSKAISGSRFRHALLTFFNFCGFVAYLVVFILLPNHGMNRVLDVTQDKLVAGTGPSDFQNKFNSEPVQNGTDPPSLYGLLCYGLYFFYHLWACWLNAEFVDQVVIKCNNLTRWLFVAVTSSFEQITILGLLGFHNQVAMIYVSLSVFAVVYALYAYERVCIKVACCKSVSGNGTQRCIVGSSEKVQRARNWLAGFVALDAIPFIMQLAYNGPALDPWILGLAIAYIIYKVTGIIYFGNTWYSLPCHEANAKSAYWTGDWHFGLYNFVGTSFVWMTILSMVGNAYAS